MCSMQACKCTDLVTLSWLQTQILETLVFGSCISGLQEAENRKLRKWPRSTYNHTPLISTTSPFVTSQTASIKMTEMFHHDYCNLETQLRCDGGGSESEGVHQGRE